MKTKEQLLDELAAAQERIAELENLERERGPAEEEARKRAAQAALLYEVGQRVSGKLRLEALFSEIVTAIRDTFDYDGVLLMLVDAETERLALKTVAGGYADILPSDLSVSIGEGMTGQAAATGEAQISGDVTKNPHYVQKAEETTRSELAVPITSGQTVIGVLDLQSDQYDAFDEADVMLMETLADQLAVAIENARLYETVQEELVERRRAEDEAQRRVAQAALLYEVGQRVSGKLRLEALFSEIVTAIRDAFDYDGVLLWLVDAETERVVLEIVAGGYADILLRGVSLAIGEGMTGQAAATGEAQISGDVAKNPHYVQKAGETTRSELAVPITSGQTVIGVLDMQSDQYDAFDEADVMLMETLADQLAVAIENARLYETVQEELVERRRAEDEAQRRAAHAALLYEVGHRVSSTLDLEVLLSEIVVAVRDTFDYDGVHLMLLDDQANRLTLQTMAGSYADLTPKNLWVAMGEGMTGRAAAMGETQLSGDVSQTSYYVPRAEEKTKAELAVPIKSREKVIGVLDLQSDEYDAFDETDVILMETLADQLAVAIENARLYYKVQQELDGRKRIEKALRESQEAFNTVLDSIDADVYVADFDTYEILFMNQHMRDNFGTDFTGETCWEVFREGSEPCDHCTNAQLLDANGEPTGVCVWEGQNPITERWYINYDRAIKWVDGRYVRLQIATDITKVKQAEEALQQSYAEVEKRVEERTAELERESAERERLQGELIEAQRQALRELSTPIIPMLDRIIVMPLVGSIDSMRARDITRSLLAGIQKHRAKVVILDITGVPIVDSGVADHLNKTIQAARLKGARTMITGISDAVAETIVDLGIDWQSITTLGDLQSGLIVALRSLGVEVRRREAGSGTW